MIDESFRGLNRVQQQRAVYAALGGLNHWQSLGLRKVYLRRYHVSLESELETIEERIFDRGARLDAMGGRQRDYEGVRRVPAREPDPRARARRAPASPPSPRAPVPSRAPAVQQISRADAEAGAKANVQILQEFGGAMPGLETGKLPESELMQTRGW